MEKRKSSKRTFQPQPRPEQDDMWYSSIPLDVMWGIYARQSTPAQVLNNAESTEMQTDDLIKWLVDRGIQEGRWKLFDADLGVSGTLPIMDRTALQELVELIKAGKIKAVLVYQISRLFRDDTGVEYNTFAKICKEHNCILVTADGMVFNFNNRMHMKMFRFLAEYAAEYIPQQIGLLHAARMRKARRGFYAGFGVVPRGYIVDYDKDSPTYKRFMLYHGHIPYVLNLFERFYALGGDLAQFCREVDEMPYVFPYYESWVDRRNIRDKRWKKVPGGYHITRTGLIALLTNPVYIGWLIIQGDIVSTSNHEPLIPPEKQYLFWYAFDHLSEYTTSGEVNEKRKVEPRRFYHRHTTDKAGLLKNRIYTPTGQPIYVHLSGLHRYCTRKEDTRVLKSSDSVVDVGLIDPIFTEQLFLHLRETHDFDSFRQWADEVTQRQATQLEIINAQLEEIEQQQEAILDEKIAIRSHINQQIKEALSNDPTMNADKLKARFEEEARSELERLRKRSAKLDERKNDLEAKQPDEENDQQLRNARTLADFQTEIEKLEAVWDLKPLKERREFVNLLVKRTTLSIAATHWVKFTIEWTHPAWANETLYIYRQRGDRNEWTEEEREILGTHYEKSDRKILLTLLPHKSWEAIKKEARLLKIRRPRSLGIADIDNSTTWSDYELRNSLGIPPNSRDTLCFVEASNTKNEGLWAHKWYRQL